MVDAMSRDFPQVPGNITMPELVDRHILRDGRHDFVVNDGTGPVGLVTLSALQEVPRAEWPSTTASEVMVPLQKLDTTRPDAVLWSALEKMGRDGVNELPVVNKNEIVGMLSREDLLHYIGVLRALSS